MAAAIALGSTVFGCGGSNMPSIAGTAGSGGGGTTGAAGSGAAGSGAAGSGAAGRGAAGTGAAGAGAAGSGAAGSGVAGSGAAGRGGASGSSGAAGTGGSSTAGTGGSAGGGATTPGSCGYGDTNLPAEPTISPACSTLDASFAITAGTTPSESNLDTTRIQNALNACGSGHSLKLVTSGSNNGFITGPISIPSGVTLWVDTGVTLFGTRDPNVYGSQTALITARGSNSAIAGDGAIDGQGGEPQIGSTQTSWDINGGGGDNPALIQATNAANFTMYRITLHNAPKFHVKMAAAGFVVWGVTIKTPSASKNSVGTTLTPSVAHNTDGIDPGQAASNGYIVCSKIWVGDDNIAIKGATNTNHLTIAHNHFGAGHGMSIGSETNGGVSNINVYDLSIDGTGTGLSGGSSNGIRIKSDSSRGGLVTNITYSDVCVRGLTNPIIITPFYSSSTGGLIPTYNGITIKNFRSMSTSVTPKVTLLGYDSSHKLGITLDNVVVDDISSSNINAADATITLGPGMVNFTPSGTDVTVTNQVSGSSTANACANKWVTF